MITASTACLPFSLLDLPSHCFATGSQSKSGAGKHITLEGKTFQKSLTLVTLPSVNSEEIKGCRCSYRKEKEGWGGDVCALSGGSYKCRGVCSSYGNTGTSSPVTAVPPAVSEDCSHVRRRCHECVFHCPCLIVWGSRDFKTYSANN